MSLLTFILYDIVDKSAETETAGWNRPSIIKSSAQNQLRSVRFCILWYYGQTERSLKTRVSEHKKAVLMFGRNSKLACHVHECHHHMDFENVEVVGHEAHYPQRLFLEAWMSVKDPNVGNDHIVIPEVYKCLART